MPEVEVNVRYASQTKKIEVEMDPFTIEADGGDRTDPSPGALFIAGVLACTASTARGYCRRNQLPSPTGLSAKITFNDETHLIENVEMALAVPADFPKERLEALERAAGTCTVKNFWQNPPEFLISTHVLT
jgi:uncharacterized OsmC-like protein